MGRYLPFLTVNMIEGLSAVTNENYQRALPLAILRHQNESLRRKILDMSEVKAELEAVLQDFGARPYGFFPFWTIQTTRTSICASRTLTGTS